MALADAEVVGILCEVSSSGSDGKKSNHKGKDKKSSQDNTNSSNGSTGDRKILFQSISNNTSDFQMVSSQITPLFPSTTTTTNTATDPKKKGRAVPNVPSAEAEYKAVRGLDRLEVARLYKIALSPALGYSQAAAAAGLSPTTPGTHCTF